MRPTPTQPTDRQKVTEEQRAANRRKRILAASRVDMRSVVTNSRKLVEHVTELAHVGGLSGEAEFLATLMTAALAARRIFPVMQVPFSDAGNAKRKKTRVSWDDFTAVAQEQASDPLAAAFVSAKAALKSTKVLYSEQDRAIREARNKEKSEKLKAAKLAAAAGGATEEPAAKKQKVSPATDEKEEAEASGSSEEEEEEDDA